MEELNRIENEEIEVYEDCEIQETKRGGSIGKIVLGLGAAAVAGVAAYVIKKKNASDDKKVADLEAKGYTVIKPEIEDVEVEAVDEDIE